MIIIEPITTAEGAAEVLRVELVAWDTDPIGAVPVHIHMAMAKNGGVLLGAYHDGRLVGYTLGWLGLIDPHAERPATEQLKLVSHMTGVLPDYRDQGIGYRLKLAQREWALARNLELITWTYDPLESRNANLNLHRLGVVCRTYQRNVYGSMIDRVNAGVESDRFLVQWWITTPRVKNRLAAGPPSLTLATADAQLINPAVFDPQGYPHPAEETAAPSDSRVLVEIPARIQAIRRTSHELTAVWRAHTRNLFESLFAAGYQVTDLIYEPDPSRPRSFYLLEQTDED
jgi:predicted GNAT superfamily acetyltransferase